MQLILLSRAGHVHLRHFQPAPRSKQSVPNDLRNAAGAPAKLVDRIAGVNAVEVALPLRILGLMRIRWLTCTDRLRLERRGCIGGAERCSHGNRRAGQDGKREITHGSVNWAHSRKLITCRFDPSTSSQARASSGAYFGGHYCCPFWDCRRSNKPVRLLFGTKRKAIHRLGTSDNTDLGRGSRNLRSKPRHLLRSRYSQRLRRRRTLWPRRKGGKRFFSYKSSSIASEATEAQFYRYRNC